MWEQVDGTTRIVSEPTIGYDGKSLQLQILQLDEGDIGKSEMVARSNHSAAIDLANEINKVGRTCSKPHVAVRIDSSYHDGWYRFIEDALGESEYSEVSVEHNETTGTVEARITEIRETDSSPSVIIADDHGLVGPGGKDLDHDQRLARSLEGDGGPNSGVFGIEAVLENTNNMKHTETVTVTIWDDELDDKLLEESTDITFRDDGQKSIRFPDIKFEHGTYKDKLEHGETYKYVIETESGDRTDDPPGSFYVGEPDSSFQLSNGTATTAGDNVTIGVELQNIGVKSDTQNVSLELEYQDDLPADLEKPYGIIGGQDISRSFGESNPATFTVNGSRLLDGEYEATIRTDDDVETVSFNVTAGFEPGRTGLNDVKDANVTVEVIASQVSGTLSRTSEHQLSPMTLDVIANGNTVHSFTNPEGGTNINTGPTWQNKSDESYRYHFTVDGETDLTLRNTRYSATRTEYWWGIPVQAPTCADRQTNPATLSHYSGPTYQDLTWCTDVPDDVSFGPIDASQGKNLQNVRVRSAKNNSIPALPAGASQQLSATEVLQERRLIKPSGDELDLSSGEFVFLFDNTVDCENAKCDEDDIDALWNDAIKAYQNNPHQPNDPDFNDLIVYVEVERAGVNPGKPGITIKPGSGDDTQVGAGNSDTDETSSKRNKAGINPDTSSIVIG
ncbi:hypothetical protein [Natrinema hispanicum]|uniref:hypothetical protein n=1 Tax=Natrinema hispanicum TaxID=392421 RepID=UPI001CB6F9F7|nr:hypothetical protein [Natrinema hispanicum]